MAALAATVLLTLGVRSAEAAPKCSAPGASCKMNKQCCSGTCIGGSAMGRPSGTCGGANGSPCSANSQCANNHCVGGVCCNTACSGQCDGSCATGTCAPASVGTPCNDGNFCTVSDACNASRACVGTGNPCAGNSQCTECVEASDACAFEGTICGNDGDSCTFGYNCLSGNCVDGVCCDTTCSGSCEACSAAKKGSGDDGVCGSIAQGSDPDDECPAADPGCGSGACDGAGACDVALSGAQCDDGLFCTGTDTCDGSGGCVGGSDNPCSFGSCPDCVEESDGCAQEGTLCGQPTGESCASSIHCSSTYCVDGFCCDAPCDAACEACSSAKTGVTNGSCADIPAGSDPDDECAADSAGCASGSCNGLGECDVSFSGTPCNDGNQCSDTDRCDGAGNCQQQTGNGCEEGDACVQEGTVCEPN